MFICLIVYTGYAILLEIICFNFRLSLAMASTSMSLGAVLRRIYGFTTTLTAASLLLALGSAMLASLLWLHCSAWTSGTARCRF